MFVALGGHSVAWEPAKSIVLSASLTPEQADTVESALWVTLEFSLMMFLGWGPGQPPEHLVIKGLEG